MQLADTRAVLTGASRGLGRALSLRLAEAGTRLALVARGQDPLAEVVSEIRRAGGQAHPIVADVGAPEAGVAIAAQAAAALGAVDLLVHNASTLGHVPLRLLLDTDDAAIEHAFQVNALGPFRLTKALVGPMLLGRGGLVVTISSDAAVERYPSWGAYGASKAAQDHLHRIWAAELADTSVRILDVDPGEMDTRMHADAVPDADPATLARPEQVAEQIVELIRAAHDVPTGSRVAAAAWRAAS